MTKWEKIEATPHDDRYFGYCDDMKEYLKVDGALLPKNWGSERQICPKTKESENEKST